MSEDSMTPTRGLHRLEADVALSDGTIVRVSGLAAVRFRDDPEAVRIWVEQIRAEQAVRKRRREGKCDE